MIATDPAHPTIRRGPAPPLDRIALDLPLPPKELQPNKRLGRHWGKVNKHRVQAKSDAFSAFYAVVGPDPPPWKAVAARAIIIIGDGRERLDDDNAQGWLKNTVDQLASCLGINDRKWRWKEIEFKVDKAAQPGIRLEMWEERAETLYVASGGDLETVMDAALQATNAEFQAGKLANTAPRTEGGHDDTHG